VNIDGFHVKFMLSVCELDQIFKLYVGVIETL